MKRLPLALFCVALSLAACAQDANPSVAAKPGAQSRKPVVAAAGAGAEPTFAAGSAETRARDTIRKLAPTVRIDQIGAALGLASWVAIVGTPAPGEAVDAFGLGWAFMAVTAVLAGLALLPMARGRLVHTLPV